MPEVRYVGLAALRARALTALEVGVVHAATDYTRRAQAATPVKTGTLRASIHAAGPVRGGSSVTVRVATGGESSSYAVLVHEGTGPHVIRAKPGHTLAFNGIFRAQVNHPGTRAYKYMSRPLEQMAGTYETYIAAAARAAF